MRHVIIHFPTSSGVSGANERANGRASGPVLTSEFSVVPDLSDAVYTSRQKSLNLRANARIYILQVLIAFWA